MSDETETTETTEKPEGITPEQFAALQESVAKLEAKNRELLEERAHAKKAAEEAAMEAAKKSGDLESLEKSWREKYEGAKTELSSEIQKYQQMITAVTSGAEARKLAADLAMPGHADLLLPHIQSRLATEIKDGAPTIRVLGSDGAPSALTIDDLKKEIMSTPLFAPILAGSKANGGGSAGKSDGGTVKNRDWGSMTDDERKALLRDDPIEYRRVVDAYYGRS